MTALPAYRESQFFTMTWLLMPLIAATVIVATLSGGAGWPVAVMALAPALLMPLLLGRLTIEIDDRELRWHFGYLGWPRWSVQLGDIAEVRRITTRAVQGSGIRGFGRERLFNTQIAGTAVALTLRDGRRITLGSPQAERQASFILARLPKAG
jgi:hypothetical protein